MYFNQHYFLNIIGTRYYEILKCIIKEAFNEEPRFKNKLISSLNITQ